MRCDREHRALSNFPSVRSHSRVCVVKAILVLLLSLHAAAVSAQDARLMISVRDERDAPIAEARVEIWRTNPPPALSTLIASRSTDALGTVELTVEPFRGYLIRATHPDYVSFEPMPFMPNDPTPRGIWPFAGDVAIPIKLSSRTYPGAVGRPPSPPTSSKGFLWGRVLSATGKPLADMRVSVESSTYSIGGTAYTRTAKDGSYRLDLDEGIYKISAGGDVAVGAAWASPVFTTYARHPEIRARVRNQRSTHVDLVLNPVRLFNVTVTVIDDQGLNLPAADVFAFADRRGWGASNSKRTTGQDGSTPLYPMLPGPVDIAVRGTKDGRSLVGHITVDIHDAPVEVTVQLVPSVTISGRVEFLGRVDPLHNREGLRVTHVTPGAPPRGELNTDPSGRVDVNGEFVVLHAAGQQCLRLTGIPQGWRLRDITYNGEDYMERPFSLPSDESLSSVVIHVEPGPYDSSLSLDCSGPKRR
jgi:hypothetical protein